MKSLQGKFGVNGILIATFFLVHAGLLAWSVFSAPPGWELLGSLEPYYEFSIRAGALHLPSLFTKWELWRLLTNAFIHGPWFHLLFNCLAMYSIGRVGEQLWGSSRHALLFLVSALGASLLSMAVVESAMTVGASGGIFGVAVALILELRIHHSENPQLGRMASSLTKQIGGWLVAGLAASIWTDLPISAYGHLGGAITGAITWGCLCSPRFRSFYAIGLSIWVLALASSWNAKWRPLKYQSIVAYEAASHDDCSVAARLLAPLVADNQDDAHLLNTWAYCEVERGGNLQAALRAGRKALALEPEDPNIMDTVGWALCLFGEVKEGQALLDRSVLLSDHDEVLVDHAQRCSRLRPSTDLLRP